MDRIHDTVAWYQQKKEIGSYDKQLWEQSVEHKVLKNIRHLPRRSVRLKTELIDVDLVRGSTFTKVTPQVPWSYVTLKTIGRVLFFPLYYKWWIQQTSWKFWLVLLALYVMQVGTTIFFFIQLDEKITQHEPVFSEVMIPGLLMVLLGLIHSQTVLSHMSLKPPVRDKKDGLSLRRKRSLSQTKTSVTNMDSVNSKVLGKSSSTSQSEKSQMLQVNSKEKKPGSSSVRDKADSSSSSIEGKSRKEKKMWPKSSKNNSPNHHLKESSRNQKEAQAGRRGSQDSESAYISHDASDSHERTSSHEAEVEAAVTMLSRPVVKDETFEGGIEKRTDKRIILSDFRSHSRERESQDSDVPEESPYEKDRSHTDEEKDTASEDEQTFNVLPTDASRSNPKGCTRSESQNSNLTVTSETDDCMIYREDGHKESCDQGSKEKFAVKADVHLVKVEKNNQNYFQRNPKHVDDWHDSSSFMANGTVKPVCDMPENGTAIPVSGVPENDTSTLQCENYKTNLQNENNVDLNTVVLGGPESHITIEVIGGNAPLSMANQSTRQSKSSSEESMLASKRVISIDMLSVDKTASEKISIYPRKTILSETSRSDTVLQNRTNLSPTKVRSAYICDSDTDNEESPNYKSVSGLRRRKVTLQEGSDFKTKRDKRPTLLLTTPKDDRASTCISSSDGENNITLNPDYNQKQNTVSSEEWEDRMQTDVSTSSYSSSCCSDADIMDNEPEQSEEGGGEIQQPYSTLVQGMSGNNVHLVNLLQPPSSTNQSQGHGQPDKVTCIIWELNECKKIELTAMDIGWAIIETVDKIPESSDYIRIGLMFSMLMALTPLAFHIYHNKDLHILTCGFHEMFQMVLNNPWRLNLIVVNGIIQRLCLSSIFFFLHSVADRTFKQRLLYAKHFCYLTSSRRARKFDMPHFRLNKVRNIKTWLSLRSYLKKRGPQRSVDMIVSSSFLLTIILLILMCLQLLQEPDTYLDCLCNWELLVWCLALGVYLLRFMTLGLKINKKYRNLSVLITEQINLYLQMEQKPHKKEELMVSNNVLKLAESLIKELESPFKISGISANPFFLNVTKVVVLSAFSAVLSEILGFKLKLTKIKLKD